MTFRIKDLVNTFVRSFEAFKTARISQIMSTNNSISNTDNSFYDADITFKDSILNLSDPYSLPQSVDDFKEWHYKVLRKLDKHAEKENFSGYITLQVNIPEFIRIAKKLELIDYAYYDKCLSFLTNDVLKRILKKDNLSLSGNKKELVSRILENISELDVRNLDEYCDFYILTDKGHEIIQNSISKLEKQHTDFFKRTIDLILNQEFKSAYQNICKKNAEMPIPPGINCDWENRYYRGITDSMESVCKELIKKSDNVLFSACAIYSSLSGDSLQNVVGLFNKLYPGYNYNNSYENIRYMSSMLSNNINFLQYEEAGITEYQFLSTLDKETCPICGFLDGKIFYISERQIGVNCPPMHKGCRCTTISVLSKHTNIIGMRSARDANGKNMKVPSSMNWLEWKNTYGSK